MWGGSVDFIFDCVGLTLISIISSGPFLLKFGRDQQVGYFLYFIPKSNVSDV